MLQELLLAGQLMFGAIASDEQTPGAITTLSVSKGDIICVSAQLAERYAQALSTGDTGKLAWYSSGCAKANQPFEDQKLVRLTSYGAVVQLTNGRWSRERHILFAQPLK